MYCEKCGQKIEEGEQFCMSCGAKIASSHISSVKEADTLKQINLNKLIFPVAIILTALILGGFFYATQVSKQESIERQKALDIKAQQDKEQAEKTARQNCNNEAAQHAKDLLVTKSQLPGGGQYNAAVEKGLFLQGDFDTYYEQCLNKEGLKK